MSKTYLQLVSKALLELGLDTPTTVSGATDPQTLQIGALMNREGEELMKAHDWTALQAEWIINVAAPTITTGSTTINSGVITNIPTTTGLVAGTYFVAADNIPSAARIASVDSATQVTLTEHATSTASGVIFTFSLDTYPIPTDFDRFIARTHWDRTNHWELIGPQSPQFDQWQRSGIVTTGPRRRWRQIGHLPSVFRLWPRPTATDTPSTLAWEYVSNQWAVTAAGVYAGELINDTDLSLFDDNLMIIGTKLRFFSIKGFDTAKLERDYNRALDMQKSRDGGTSTLSLTRRAFQFLISPANVPDSGFGNP